jgi:hypothetical protein
MPNAEAFSVVLTQRKLWKIAAFLDMVSVEPVGRIGDRAALPVFGPLAAVASALEHRGGPFTMVCGL